MSASLYAVDYTQFFLYETQKLAEAQRFLEKSEFQAQKFLILSAIFELRFLKKFLSFLGKMHNK